MGEKGEEPDVGKREKRVSEGGKARRRNKIKGKGVVEPEVM